MIWVSFLISGVRKLSTSRLVIMPFRCREDAPTKREKLIPIVSFVPSDTWGDQFPVLIPDWDIVIASDILLCKCSLLISRVIIPYFGAVC